MTDIEIKNLKTEIKNLEDRLKCTKGERAQIIKDELKIKKEQLIKAGSNPEIKPVIGVKTISDKEKISRNSAVTISFNTMNG